MADFRFDANGHGLAEWERDLRKGAIAAPLACARITRHHGQLLQTQAKANASGRPGPHAVTGNYRRSLLLQLDSGSWGARAEVGTDEPQGARLELGFEGEDSLGRNYHQPPYPHLGPALDTIGPDYERDLAAGVILALAA